MWYQKNWKISTQYKRQLWHNMHQVKYRSSVTAITQIYMAPQHEPLFFKFFFENVFHKHMKLAPKKISISIPSKTWQTMVRISLVQKIQEIIITLHLNCVVSYEFNLPVCFILFLIPSYFVIEKRRRTLWWFLSRTQDYVLQTSQVLIIISNPSFPRCLKV